MTLGRAGSFREVRGFVRGGRVWSESLLDANLLRFEILIQGTSMAYHGLRQAAERADVIAYPKVNGTR